jgi:hypothetical protein
MLAVEDFQKFAGIPFGIARFFKSLIPQQSCANRRKNTQFRFIEENSDAAIE